MASKSFLIPKDDDSARTWLERYKDFRLLSLKTAPDAFLSTYEREAAFEDDTWFNRLTNPDAFTFVTIDSSRIVASLTMIGPMPYIPEDHSPLQNPWLPPSTGKTTPAQELTTSHWRINAMFVLPEVRRQGAARDIIESAIVYARGRAVLSGKEFVASLAVDDDNLPAKYLYEKSSFVTIKSECEKPDSSRMILLMKYMPRVQEAA